MFAPTKELQIGQPIVLLVAVDMVDKFPWFKASSEALSDDKPVLIYAPPLVCHWQIWAV